MREFIHKLKAKPERVKRRITAVVSSALFLLIAGAWSLTLPGRIAEINGSAPVLAEGESPLQSLQANVKTGFKSLRSNFENSKNDVAVEEDSAFSDETATTSNTVILEDESRSFE